MRHTHSWLLYVVLGWIFNLAVCYAIVPSHIKNDLETRCNRRLADNGFADWQVAIQGMDAIIRGPELPRGHDVHPEEEFVRDEVLRMHGIHSILGVQYGTSNAGIRSSAKQRIEYFVVSRSGQEVTVRGEFSSVAERSDVFQQLTDMFGSMRVRQMGTVNSDAIPKIDADSTLAKMGWMKELENFIFEYDGDRIEISGEAPSKEKVRAISDYTRKLFGSKTPVINRMTVDGKHVESPPKKPITKTRSLRLPRNSTVASIRLSKSDLAPKGELYF